MEAAPTGGVVIAPTRCLSANMARCVATLASIHDATPQKHFDYFAQLGALFTRCTAAPLPDRFKTTGGSRDTHQVNLNHGQDTGHTRAHGVF